MLVEVGYFLVIRGDGGGGRDGGGGGGSDGGGGPAGNGGSGGGGLDRKEPRVDFGMCLLIAPASFAHKDQLNNCSS